jgi:hypothetical protein
MPAYPMQLQASREDAVGHHTGDLADFGFLWKDAVADCGVLVGTGTSGLASIDGGGDVGFECVSSIGLCGARSFGGTDTNAPAGSILAAPAITDGVAKNSSAGVILVSTKIGSR